MGWEHSAPLRAWWPLSWLEVDKGFSRKRYVCRKGLTDTKEIQPT